MRTANELWEEIGSLAEDETVHVITRLFTMYEEMLKKKPDAFGNGLILAALPATQGLYGFVGFIMYNTALGSLGDSISLLQGAVVMGAGVALGLAALISAIQQGKVCANGIAAIGSGHNVFGNTFILAVFPEFYAILALVAAILMQGLLS